MTGPCTHRDIWTFGHSDIRRSPRPSDLHLTTISRSTARGPDLMSSDCHLNQEGPLAGPEAP